MYAKVFASLWDGTLYGKTDAQLVFIFLLARCDMDGYVRVVPDAIAAPTGLTLERVSAALELLEAPDPNSGTQTSEGRRIVRAGDSACWTITNYLKYRGMRDIEERRKQNREAQTRFRSKPESAKISLRKPPSSHAEAEVDAEVDCTEIAAQSLAQLALSNGANGHDPSPEAWFLESFWPVYPRRVGRARALQAFMAEVHRTPKARLDDLATELLAGLQREIGQEWANRELDKIPHAATWITQRRWEDDR